MVVVIIRAVVVIFLSETGTATTLLGNHSAAGSGLSEILVADHANFAVGDQVRVMENAGQVRSTSQNAVAGDTRLQLDSVGGLAVHDPIHIGLDSGALDFRWIRKISGLTVTLDDGLSSASTSPKSVTKIGWSYGRIGVKDTTGGDRLEFVKPAAHNWPGGNSGNPVQKLNEYLPYPFEIELGNSEPGSFTGARLRIDNIDRSILAAFRALKPSDEAAEVTIRVVLADTPEVVEFETPPLAWRGLGFDNQTIQGDLSAPSFLVTAFPATYFTPTNFPNIFSQI